MSDVQTAPQKVTLEFTADELDAHIRALYALPYHVSAPLIFGLKAKIDVFNALNKKEPTDAV